jgi:small-conductance mechanosensitive channel
MDEAKAIAEVSANEAAQNGGLLSLLPKDGILGRLFTMDAALTAIRVVLAIVLGAVVVGVVVTLVRRVTAKRMDARTSGLIVKVTQYLGLALIAINALDAAKVNLSGLLGAAGIAGIALGFAAQTTVSNFISGFFLVSEKTFSVGDVITIEGSTGVVYSVDALSIKLRSFDNQLIRIPNEALIKTRVTNITRFPARRLNINLVVTYDTDLDRLRTVLMELASANQFVLRKPEPLYMVQRFGDNGVELLFGVWLAKEDWVSGNNSVLADIKRRFEAEGIEFAFPTRTIYTKAEDPAPAPRAKKKAVAKA